jgi:hypothetical protein
MTAFANHRGGKIVFGVSDDKEPEGADLNQEMCLGTISEIIEDYCSPTPKIEHKFYSESEGDLSEGSILVLEVLEKNDSPPVAVVDNSEGRIKKREYRIRSGESTRFVSDGELTALFTDTLDQHIKNEHKIVYTHNKEIEPIDMEPKPRYFHEIDSIYQKLNNSCENLGDLITKEEEIEGQVAEYMLQEPLFSRVFLILVLDNLGINAKAKEGGKIRPSINENSADGLDVKERGISAVEFSSIEDDDIFGNLDVSILELIKRDSEESDEGEVTFPLPDDGTIWFEDDFSRLHISSENNFDISIGLEFYEGHVGFPHEHPDSSVKKLKRSGGFVDADRSVWTMKFRIKCSIELNYPKQSYSEYTDSIRYFEDFIEPIMGKYDWEDFVSRLPDAKLQKIEDKIDEINEKLDTS